MKSEIKGISPVVGTILLIAITVALAVAVGVIVSGLSGRGAPPSAFVNVTATGSTISDGIVIVRLDHRGGDALSMSELTVKAEDIDGDLVEIPMTWPTVLDISDTAFGTYTYDTHATERTEGAVVRIVVIHNPSKTFLVDTNVLVG